MAADIASFLIRCLPGLPLEAAWLAPAILILLGIAAIIDARTGRVPDSVILGGLLVTVFAEGFYADWHFAGLHMLVAFAAGMLLYGINEIWYSTLKSDAFGMGDAKWTSLAIACFNLKPALIAWGLGACLAVLWLGLLRIAGRKTAQVHFAPFLWIGLMAGIYSLRMR